jgi:anti-sigma B factor antagonist/stage II sporulation protein AA (anti-sigma F factor antagonist)
VKLTQKQKGRIFPISLLKIRHKMEAIERIIEEGIAVEKINFVRATMNEAFKIKNNLAEDSFDYGKIIVDLSSCDYIDSTFLGALIYSYRNIIARKSIMVLVIGDTQLSKSFIYHEIIKMFRVYGTLIEAIAELNKEEKKHRVEKLQQIQLSCTDTIDIINY